MHHELFKHCKRFSSLLVQSHHGMLLFLGNPLPFAVSLDTKNSFLVINLSKTFSLVIWVLKFAKKKKKKMRVRGKMTITETPLEGA